MKLENNFGKLPSTGLPFVTNATSLPFLREPTEHVMPLPEHVGLPDAPNTVDHGSTASDAHEDMPQEGAMERSWYPDSYTHVIKGTNGDDVIHGKWDGPNYVDAGPGNDSITTYDYDDRIDADSGRDQVFSGRGNDIVLGGEDDDYLKGEGGNDVLKGEGGNDILKGGTGKDVLYGNDGNDALFGNDGNDKLFGGAGDDALDGGLDKNIYTGGAGKDVFHLSVDETMFITDFEWGEDKINLWGAKIIEFRSDPIGALLYMDNGSKIYLHNIDPVDAWLHQEIMFL